MIHNMIHKIAVTTLPQLKPLLDQSAGYEVSLDDEIEYFESENPLHWFYASVEGNHRGFIRDFPQGNWGTAELFISATDPAVKGQTVHSLLMAFLESASFEKGFRLRFEIPADDGSLSEQLKKMGFQDRVESFCHYERDLAYVSAYRLTAQKAQIEDVAQVKAVFKNLHPVEEGEVSTWIKNGSIYVHRLNNEIISAAQVHTYDESAEIIRIATNARFLQKNGACSLLSALHCDLKKRSVRNIFLKVAEEKSPARKLYEKTGYQHLKDKDQVWLSRIF